MATWWNIINLFYFYFFRLLLALFLCLCLRTFPLNIEQRSCDGLWTRMLFQVYTILFLCDWLLCLDVLYLRPKPDGFRWKWIEWSEQRAIILPDNRHKMCVCVCVFFMVHFCLRMLNVRVCWTWSEECRVDKDMASSVCFFFSRKRCITSRWMCI